MSTYQTWWSPEGDVETCGATDGALYLTPGRYDGGRVVIYRPRGMSPEQMLTVANRVLAGVQRWRDTVAEQVERERTTAVELAEARAEIARLRGEQTGGAA